MPEQHSTGDAAGSILAMVPCSSVGEQLGEVGADARVGGLGDGAHGATLGTIARISSTASQSLREIQTLSPLGASFLGGPGGSPPGVVRGVPGGDRERSDRSEASPPAAPRAQGSGLLRRFELQSYARDIFKRERVAKCLRAPVPGRSVDVLYAPASGSGHFGGLQVCGSVWLCPVCASKVSERRRVELAAGVAAWGAEPARSCVLVTLTLRHKLGQSLASVLRMVKRAYDLLRAGRWWVELAASADIVGSVRSLEVTHGASGWHPHLHVLFFLSGPPPAGLEDALRARWVRCVAADGGFASYEHGCDVRHARGDVAAYVAKYGREPAWTVAHEVTKAAVKLGRGGGRSAFQLLADYALGDEDAGRLFLLYGCAFKGQRQLYWSHGLRSLLGLGEELSDVELAVEQSEIAVILASLTPAMWRIVLGNDARADLLQVASSGDAGAVREWLRGLGVVM